MTTPRAHRFASRLNIKVRLTVQNLIMVGLILAIIFLSARSTSVDRQRALIDNVAGRQPELIHRYLNEVLLVSEGFTADPKGTYDKLRSTAAALLDGGAVLAVQGNDKQVHIPPQSNPVLRAKLDEEVRLIGQLGDLGDAISSEQPGSAKWKSDIASAVDLSHVTANVAHDAVGALTKDAEQSVAADARRQIEIAAIGIAVTLIAGWGMSRQIVRRLRSFGQLAKATASGDLSVRYPSDRRDEIGVLGGAFNEMADSLARLVGQLEADARRDDFGRQLSEAFEMVDDENAALAIVTRAMGNAAAETPIELLVTSTNQSDLHLVAAHPTAGGPGCSVDSPFGCVAVRRGAPTVFASSESLNACPKLVNRPTGPCSAVCVPVTFMGRALGVLHATGPVGAPPSADEQHRLVTLASLSGARLGTVRAFNESQEQATTDPLTGLFNRRAIENRLARLTSNKVPFALAMADLDHFKMLNDSYGHDSGDQALKQFANVLRNACRADDAVGRWGGEEFVAVFVGATPEEARSALNRLRQQLAKVLEGSNTPQFTSSFGVAHSSDYHGVDELIRAADTALYHAKDNGRDQVVLSTPMTPARERRLVEAVAANFEGIPSVD